MTAAAEPVKFTWLPTTLATVKVPFSDGLLYPFTVMESPPTIELASVNVMLRVVPEVATVVPDRAAEPLV